MSPPLEAAPFLRVDPVRLVPVIPNRLGGAVLVRRAVVAVEAERGPLDRRDVIAVALPPSMSIPLRTAVEKLPKVSLLVSRAKAEEAREVFGVTPCDGIVEAARIAIERDLPLRFVDREVAPGNLRERDCSFDPEWGDDWYAVEQGPEKYLRMCGDNLQFAPRRQEPVDTWREHYMALELRRLCALFRRVLFICQAPHALPVRELLTSAMPGRGLEEEDGPEVSFRVESPPEEVRLRYLDDIPRLVERFERVRGTDGTAVAFDKRAALLTEIRDFAGRLKMGRPSARELKAFCKLFPAQLRAVGRLAPQLEDCEILSRCCFTREFSRALRSHLLGYLCPVGEPRLVATDGSRLPQRGGTPREEGHPLSQATDRERSAAPRGRTRQRTEHEDYVARGCNPLHRLYSILKPSPPRHIQPYAWPRWSEHHNSMRRKVYRAALAPEPVAVVREYRGSLEQGIDIRRMLASYYRGERRLFVRREVRRRRFVHPARHEPIVWIFAEPGLQPKIETRNVVARQDQTDLYRLLFLVHTGRTSVYAEPKTGGRVVELYRAIGAATFYDIGVTARSVTEAFGGDPVGRIPTVADLTGLCEQRVTWLDDLLGLALRFAERQIYCVAPAILRIPKFRGGVPAGKSIIWVAAEKLGLEAFQRLSSYCIVDGGTPSAQATDKTSRELIARYADIVDQMWP